MCVVCRDVFVRVMFMLFMFVYCLCDYVTGCKSLKPRCGLKCVVVVFFRGSGNFFFEVSNFYVLLLRFGVRVT